MIDVEGGPDLDGGMVGVAEAGSRFSLLPEVIGKSHK
jgi:hypothetical protein